MESELIAVIYSYSVKGKFFFVPCVTNTHGDKWEGEHVASKVEAIRLICEYLYAAYGRCGQVQGG